MPRTRKQQGARAKKIIRQARSAPKPKAKPRVKDTRTPVDALGIRARAGRGKTRA